MRRRVMSTGAAFSGSVATLCLGTALAGGVRAVCGSVVCVLAAATLGWAVRRPRAEGDDLRLCPQRGVLLNGDGETEFRPVGVTHSLICLASTGGSLVQRCIWRDSLAADGFRRIAAYALWRRNVMSDSARQPELISRKTVTERQSTPRIGRPRGQ